MDDRAARVLASSQKDLVAAWQLTAAGWTKGKLAHWTRHRASQQVHSGVYCLSAAPLRQDQRWMAATLTARRTVLSHASAGSCRGVRENRASFEVVTRHGNGGPRRHGDLLVCRLPLQPEDVTTHQGIPITTGARTLLDLAQHLNGEQLGRAFREAIRIRATTPAELHSTLARNPGRRGRQHLADLTARYAHLPYRRARSNAEARALEVLHEAMPDDPPALNVRVAGEEADLVWHDRLLIIEIDGPGFHRFADEDARKQRLWEERAGYTVRRLSSDDVYDRPAALVALARG